jgi:hypothetical protein
VRESTQICGEEHNARGARTSPLKLTRKPPSVERPPSVVELATYGIPNCTKVAAVTTLAWVNVSTVTGFEPDDGGASHVMLNTLSARMSHVRLPTSTAMGHGFAGKRPFTTIVPPRATEAPPIVQGTFARTRYRRNTQSWRYAEAAA